MALSELQRLIIAGLRVCGVDGRDIALAMLQLKTEEQQWATAEYLNTVVGKPPSKTEILRQVSRLSSL